MKKQDILDQLSGVKTGTYVKIETDIGGVEGKLFRLNGQTLLMWGEQQPAIDLTFKDGPNDILWIEKIFTQMYTSDGTQA